jgi:enterochelin esterase-like enzyme
MNSSILGQEVKYSVILPEDYFVSKKSYPVVYLLHGLGDNESSWLEYGRVSQVTDQAVRQKQIIPMIFVMPQGYRNYYVNEYTEKFLYEDMFIKELVPLIDKQYRTLADKEHRATMGYSMGGFGALVLPLRNPEVFTVSVPLSISVRTDEQYKTEEASGWDDQWGRLFGGVGTTGNERITEYYKQHSPFHIFGQQDLSAYKNLKLYIDNGDDEETLCRSNEELHMLLRDRNFPHEFRVRNGGHEFVYWRDALPNGLRFISDAFEGKPYRGDNKGNAVKIAPVGSQPDKVIHTDTYSISLPVEYPSTQRFYPVIYFLGDFDSATKKSIAAKVLEETQTGSLPPVIVVFLKANEDALTTSIIPSIEKQYRARTGLDSAP